MTDAEFLDAFRRAAIGPAEFDHRAHVRTAFLHLRDLPFDEARSRVSEGLRRLLAAAKEAGFDPPVGYHETITVFWLRRVLLAMREDSESAGGDSAAFLEAHPELLRKHLLLEHYSREHVMNDAARAAWVEPDRKPLPPV
ncbi:MAG: hypothetical protein VYC34_03195 [Planctomycetota bacterium]|nr:hypothetical protein [Planctomycetota bacterium]